MNHPSRVAAEGPGGPLTLRAAVAALRVHHGPPTPPPTAEPFELILWENVAYLAAPERRRLAFEELKRTVGTAPDRIATASRQALEKVTAAGILKDDSAAKLRECARIVLTRFDGELGKALEGPLDSAKRALRAFPGIGEPGAEKILLFTGRHALLAPESNGLRVLVRLGLIRDEGSYARTYAAARRLATGLPSDPRAVQEAHLLLQLHGQAMCKRSAPRCQACPLSLSCTYARGIGGVDAPPARSPKPRRVRT